jgi:uncharacterized protein YbjT (DUF2867 family)
VALSKKVLHEFCADKPAAANDDNFPYIRSDLSAWDIGIHDGGIYGLGVTFRLADVANAPSWEDQAVLEFFEKSGRNLLAAEAAAGVGHHVALSVVGTERLLASGYFRAKLAQENLIKASSIPYTIVRATQFFEFVGGIAQAATQGETVRLPAALMQPIVSDDVADVMADVAVAEPLNGTVELAGPEPIRQDELVRKFLSATGDPRTVTTDPSSLYYGIALTDQSLTPGDNPRIGPTRFEDWLSHSIPQG